MDSTLLALRRILLLGGVALDLDTSGRARRIAMTETTAPPSSTWGPDWGDREGLELFPVLALPEPLELRFERVPLFPREFNMEPPAPVDLEVRPGPAPAEGWTVFERRLLDVAGGPR